MNGLRKIEEVFNDYGIGGVMAVFPTWKEDIETIEKRLIEKAEFIINKINSDIENLKNDFETINTDKIKQSIYGLPRSKEFSGLLRDIEFCRNLKRRLIKASEVLTWKKLTESLKN